MIFSGRFSETSLPSHVDRKEIILKQAGYQAPGISYMDRIISYMDRYLLYGQAPGISYIDRNPVQACFPS